MINKFQHALKVPLYFGKGVREFFFNTLQKIHLYPATSFEQYVHYSLSQRFKALSYDFIKGFPLQNVILIYFKPYSLAQKLIMERVLKIVKRCGKLFLSTEYMSIIKMMKTFNHDLIILDRKSLE